MGDRNSRPVRSQKRTKTDTETTIVVVRKSKRLRPPRLGAQWQRAKERLAASASELKEEAAADESKKFPGLDTLLKHTPDKD
jgi:hypothetical protein